MSRRALRQHESSVTLFPFLAVLICTMGVLIVLLVVVVQQARSQAQLTPSEPTSDAVPPPTESLSPPETAAANAATPAPANDRQAPPVEVADSDAVAAPVPVTADDIAALEEQAQDLEWQAELLAQSREATRERVQQQRDELSKLEDQSQQLRQQLDSLETQAQELLDAEQQIGADRAVSATELEHVRNQIREAEAALAAAQQAADEVRRQYAIVPYDGPHSTRRRPIYIECRGDRVEIQPAQIDLLPEDFQPPLGPQNPLATALRAAREYLLRAGLSAATGDPYPLIVVRPDGARAYAACRSALQGWDDEFGYELIDSDVELAFPPSDDGLAQAMRDAIAQAREQQRYERGADAGLVLTVSPTRGGFVQNGGGSAGGTGGPHGREDIRPGGPFGGPTGNVAPGGASPVTGEGFVPGEGEGTVPGQGFAAATQVQPTASSAGDSGGLGRGLSVDAHAATSVQQQRTSAFAEGPTASTAGGQSSGEASQQGVGGYAKPSTGRFTGLAGQSPAARDADFGSQQPQPDLGAATGRQSSGARSGADALASGGTGSSAGPATFGGTATASGGFGTRSAGGGSAASVSMGSSTTAPSLARTRGRNWALPNAADGAIGISRPINVVCTATGLVIIPEIGIGTATQEISFSGSTQAAVQPFVSAVWQRIESWGIAGPGAYWKPMLQVTVKRDAEPRFAQLRGLMQNSGLEIIRR